MVADGVDLFLAVLDGAVGFKRFGEVLGNGLVALHDGLHFGPRVELREWMVGALGWEF